MQQTSPLPPLVVYQQLLLVLHIFSCTVKTHVHNFLYGKCSMSRNLTSKCVLQSYQTLMKQKICTKWSPHVLTGNHHAIHSCKLLPIKNVYREGNVLYHIFMVDEVWMHSFDPELKWHSAY